MSDVTYSVEVQFLQNGNFHAPAAGINKLNGLSNNWLRSMSGGIADFAGKFNGIIDNIGGAFVDFGAKASAALATAVGVGAVAASKISFEFNETMENTNIALAAIANANGMVSSFGGGMRQASEILKQMRIDAAKLPGEFKDLEGIMATITSASAQSGMGLFGTEKMAAQAMTAASILKVPMNVAGRELAMMLEGTARHAMPFFNRLGLGGASDFNKLSAKDRRLKASAAMDAIVSPAMGVIENSWTAIKSSFVDKLRQGLGTVGFPLFNTVKDIVKRFNDWVSNSTDKMRALGETLATGIQNAFLGGIETVKHWYPIVATFTETMYNGFQKTMARLSPVIQGAFSHLENFMKDPRAFDKLADTAKLLLELRVGSGLVAGAGSMMSTTAMMAAGFGGGGAAGEGALAALSAAAGPLAIILGVVVSGFYGVWSAVTDTQSLFHNFATQELIGIKSQFGSLAEIFEKGFINIKPALELLGTGFLMIINTTLGVFLDLARATQMLFDTFGSLNDRILEKLGLKKLKPEDGGEVSRAAYEYPGFVKTMNAIAEPEKGDRNHKIPQTVTHIHRVEIKVNSNQDPNRIAKRTADILGDMARHPKVAALTGTPVLSR